MQGQDIATEPVQQTIVVTREGLLLFILGLAFVSASFLMTVAVLF